MPWNKKCHPEKVLSSFLFPWVPTVLWSVLFEINVPTLRSDTFQPSILANWLTWPTWDLLIRSNGCFYAREINAWIHSSFSALGTEFTLNIFPSVSKAAWNCTCDHKLWGPLAPICSGLLLKQVNILPTLCTQPAQSHASEKKKIEFYVGRKEIWKRRASHWESSPSPLSHFE